MYFELSFFMPVFMAVTYFKGQSQIRTKAAFLGSSDVEMTFANDGALNFN